MPARALLVALSLVLAGCTRVIDAPPTSGAPVAPIPAGQVGDLLSEGARMGQDDNLFATVEPDECSGLAREVDPPLIFDARPAAHDGGNWVTDVGREVNIVEIVAVYRANVEPKTILDAVDSDIGSCADSPFTVTALEGEVDVYRLLPPRESGSPNIKIWSFEAATWACDNALVAAHNAAIEITTCGDVSGYDVLSLARDALERIERLANTTM